MQKAKPSLCKETMPASLSPGRSERIPNPAVVTRTLPLRFSSFFLSRAGEHSERTGGKPDPASKIIAKAGNKHIRAVSQSVSRRFDQSPFEHVLLALGVFDSIRSFVKTVDVLVRVVIGGKRAFAKCND